MSLETTHYCPDCEQETEFWCTASTLVHIGEKTKWRCSDCEYGFVKIGDIESDAALSA